MKSSKEEAERLLKEWKRSKRLEEKLKKRQES